MNTRIFLPLILAMFFCCSGCDSPRAERGNTQQTVDRVRSEVATILNKDSTQIDVARPLVAQGADELDIVEIVMAVEQAFDVEIPDGVIDANGGEVDKTLTVRKLAEIVAKQQ
jgi:acyl carrier protein